MSSRAQIIAEARTWLGTPYQHQASLKGVACDCLGLLRGLYRFAEGNEPEAMPAYTSDWAEAGRVETLYQAACRHLIEIPSATARPGDVLLFRWRPNLPMKHCALLVAPSRIIHAYDAAGAVAETDLAEAWQRQLAAAFAFRFVEGAH